MEASNKTRETYESVKVKADKAIEGSKAVDKINELTDSIMSISSQTESFGLECKYRSSKSRRSGKRLLRL